MSRIFTKSSWENIAAQEWCTCDVRDHTCERVDGRRLSIYEPPGSAPRQGTHNPLTVFICVVKSDASSPLRGRKGRSDADRGVSESGGAEGKSGWRIKRPAASSLRGHKVHRHHRPGLPKLCWVLARHGVAMCEIYIQHSNKTRMERRKKPLWMADLEQHLVSF